VSNAPLSDSIQDYLKGIYELQAGGEPVSISALARRHEVSPASASEMVKKLAALGLAEHAPYRGVTLTAAGDQVALEVLRHHRLLELYLAETLGIAIDAVHAEADRLEHVLSEELEARIDQALGYPTHDPHGDPIPDAELQIADEARLRSLAALEPGEKATVLRVPDDAELLPRLAALGLLPGRRVEVRSVEPLIVAVDGDEQVVPPELAEAIGTG
jgi:DtxR family transcriptional regulator, Mn-dependent transcriptional regulator